MNSLHFKPLYLVIAALLLLNASCVSRKPVVYFQGLEELQQQQQKLQNNIKIEPDDALIIRVSAPEQEAALPFNLTEMVGSLERVQGNVALVPYKVSKEGTINFPVLGEIKVTGYTVQELSKKLEEQIEDYVKDPIVNVRIENFEITVLGEVRSPGTFPVENDFISLPKALGNAGDILLTGKRDNILVMRTENGITKYAYLDITDANVLNSPFYHLKQNDVVYVEPIAPRRQAAGYLGTVGTYVGVFSAVISIVLIFTR
ncbi:sugar transporter [Christiangramia fulva]|uniref:Sugar transporter n=1 Tax=Christiangramia fulva TaxID=2126553 RepID=A0A2R3Z4U5_9FLAO|nr:polysaccharide biosynthesis/export family protein [Christiangramia fulva]AVR45285.1 sugar transporter [Christiangramia fulva]